MSETSPRLLGQSGASVKLTPQTGSAVAFAVSTPVRDLPPDEASFKPRDPDANAKAIPNRFTRAGAEVESGWADGAIAPDRSALAGLDPPETTPAPFDGLSNQDNFNAFGFRVTPSDSNGDVGPNHYVEQVNLLVRVWNKSGTPLTAPFKLSTLFTPLGGICSTSDNGDPVVLYDHLADRWLLSQFAFLTCSESLRA
jgi:hypothetical protein